MGTGGGQALRPAAARAGALRRHTGHVVVWALVASVGVVVCVGIGRVALAGADGAAVLVIVEDSLPTSSPWASVRHEERRADALVLVRWLRRCDELAITSIPRDLVLEPGGQTLSVLLETVGPDRLEHLVSSAFGTPIAATVTLDLSDVERVAGELGPVVVELPHEARDRRTGFQGGPGPVVLDAARAMTYLRARAWEQRYRGDWALITVTDEERIDRLHAYLRAALDELLASPVADRSGVVLALLRNGHVDVDDPIRAAGLLIGGSSNRRATFSVVPTIEERTIDQRRSPFAPGDLGASRRLVLDPDAPPGPHGCSEMAPS